MKNRNENQENKNPNEVKGRITIPEAVAYDCRLTPFARLLYGELKRKAKNKHNDLGFAFATNEALAAKFYVHPDTISKAIIELSTLKYIHCELSKVERNQTKRKVFILNIPVQTDATKKEWKEAQIKRLEKKREYKKKYENKQGVSVKILIPPTGGDKEKPLTGISENPDTGISENPDTGISENPLLYKGNVISTSLKDQSISAREKLTPEQKIAECERLIKEQREQMSLEAANK